MEPIRLFADRSHTVDTDRAEMAELLKPFWKTVQVSSEEWELMYGIRSDEYRVVDDVTSAHMAVLPLCWNYYLRTKQVQKAQTFIALARSAGKPVLSYVMGDEGVRVPDEFQDVWVVRASGNGADRRSRQVAQPVFFTDPLASLGLTEELLIDARVQEAARNLTGLATVGFCGQASFRWTKVILDLLRTQLRNWAFGLGWRIEEPQPLYSTALLRAKALEILGRSPRIQCKFILREKYRAGANSEAERVRTTREFYENIIASDYILCVRGGGNFSKRFYEALAMGAVPVLVDTDCVLPLDHVIPWEEYVFRVPRTRLDSLEDELISFHKRMQLAADRRQNALRFRALWRDKLTFGGFHRHLVSHVMSVSQSPGSTSA